MEFARDQIELGKPEVEKATIGQKCSKREMTEGLANRYGIIPRKGKNDIQITRLLLTKIPKLEK